MLITKLFIMDVKGPRITLNMAMGVSKVITTQGLSDVNLNRYTIETQQQYWNINLGKLKFRFDGKSRPNVYN